MRKWQEDLKGLRDFYLEHVEELGGSVSPVLSEQERDLDAEQQQGMIEYVPELELHSWHCAGKAASRARLPSFEPVQHKLGKLQRRALEFQFPVLKQRYGLLQCQGQPLASSPFDQAAEVWLEGKQGWFLANNYRVETQDTEKRFYPLLTGKGLLVLKESYVIELANQALLEADLGQSARRRDQLRTAVQQEIDHIELSVTISALVET